MGKRKHNKQEGLKLDEDLKRTVKEILIEQYGSIVNGYRAIESSVNDTIFTCRNRPLNFNMFARYFSNEGFPISPDVAKVIYEICMRDNRLDDLRKHGRNSNLGIDLSKSQYIPKVAEAKEKDYGDLTNIGDVDEHVKHERYEALKRLLDRFYDRADSSEKSRIIGELESVIESSSTDKEEGRMWYI